MGRKLSAIFPNISAYFLRVISVAAMWASFAHRPHGVDQADQLAVTTAHAAGNSELGAEAGRRRKVIRAVIRWAIRCGVLITVVTGLATLIAELRQ
jgi:hypothetical protein